MDWYTRDRINRYKNELGFKRISKKEKVVLSNLINKCYEDGFQDGQSEGLTAHN